jgi:hypothetical protein
MAGVLEFTFPINSSMIFGGSPAAGMTAGARMILAIPNNYMQTQLDAIRPSQLARKTQPAHRVMISSLRPWCGVPEIR